MIQGSDEWLASRVGMVTGSRIGAICNNSPFSNPESVLRSMVREHFAADNEFVSGPPIIWGNENEPTAIGKYEEVSGNLVAPVGFIRHPVLEWIGASPDGLIGTDGGFEAKCPYSIRNASAPEFKPIRELPHYLDQVRLCLEVTGRDWWDFFQWTPNGYSLETVERDPGWFPSVLPTLEAFHSEFLAIIKSKTKSAPFLAPKYQDRTDLKFELAAEIFENASADLKRAKDRHDTARQDLINLADGHACTGFGVSVTPVSRQGEVQYSKIPQLDGVDLDAFRGSPSTQFRVTKIKTRK